MTGKHVFKNEKLQQQIETNGYATLPFADEAMLKELREFYLSLDSHKPLKGTHVTMFNPSYEYRKLIDDKIKEVCAAKAEQLMEDYRVLYTNFMVKEPGIDGDFPLHQDWTYVDETEYSSFAFWIPLCNVDETNGALNVVQGSHRFVTALRGPHVHEPFNHISKIIKEKYAVPVNLLAGEAVIWDHRLFHFSKPNITDQRRLAFTLIMAPLQAQVVHCFGAGASATKDEIEIFNVDTDFFMRYAISKRPEGVSLLRTVMQSRKDFELDEFDRAFSTGFLKAWEN